MNIRMYDLSASPPTRSGTRKKGVRTFTEKQVRKVLDTGGKLSELEMLSCRVRYHLTDGMGLGAFMNGVLGPSGRAQF